MAEKRYYWLKLMADFFNQPRIKKLRRIAGGDTYTLIYLKLQLLSLRSDGVLRFEGIEDDFADELALTIDEEAENVRVTIAFLQAQGLMQGQGDGTYILPETIGLIGGEAYSTERVRRYRERKALQCNSHATHGNVIETDRNEDKDRESDKDIEKREDIDYGSIIERFNALCPSLPSVNKLSDERKKAIRARMNSGYAVEDFIRLFELAEQSSFLKGGNERNWRATFDWLITDRNMARTLDGNYADRQNRQLKGDSSNEEYANSGSSVRLW